MIILPVFSPLWWVVALSGLLIVMYIIFSSLLCFHFLCYLLLCWSLTWYNQVIPFFGATRFYSIRGSSYFRLAFIGISQFSPILYMSHWASTGVAFRTSQYSLPFDFGVHCVEVVETGPWTWDPGYACFTLVLTVSAKSVPQLRWWTSFSH